MPLTPKASGKGKQRALRISKQRSAKKNREYLEANARNRTMTHLRVQREKSNDRFGEFWKTVVKTDHAKEEFKVHHSKATPVKMKEQHESYTYPPQRRFGMSADPFERRADNNGGGPTPAPQGKPSGQGFVDENGHAATDHAGSAGSGGGFHAHPAGRRAVPPPSPRGIPPGGGAPENTKKRGSFILKK